MYDDDRSRMAIHVVLFEPEWTDSLPLLQTFCLSISGLLTLLALLSSPLISFWRSLPAL